MAARSFTGKGFFSRKLCPDPRTIRIIPKPQPIHFAERRAILQFLDQHGRLESFRQDIDRPGTFVAILRDKAGVEDLEKKCPIYIQVPVQKRQRRLFPTNVKHETSAARDESQYEPQQDDKSTTRSGDGHRTFKLSIFAEPNFDHKKASTKDVSSLFWNQVDMQNPSFATTALREHVPKGVTGDGLAWWDFEADSHRSTSLSHIQRAILRSLGPSRMGKEPFASPTGSTSKPGAAEKRRPKRKQDDFGTLLKDMRREV